ncbi:DUF3954 domain-containing protein [Caldibacillus debilis]|uniref:DUF3954 domain-containing protein n=1 Tax=Caldibacillus debilis GB1 TaxID=1339248 RepID=A0A420VIP0_9BACI|nr:DUF3954 domain-containing protein [Caldibacillus debilis]RKO63542.1 Protein of unknown function (DUF3954) [Caldibacillus debilis GB1]
MKIDTEKMIAEISLLENAVYRVIDGRIEKVDKPGNGFGKQTITWQNGKPVLCEISYTVK